MLAPQDVKAIRNALQLTQDAMGKLFRVNTFTVRRWEKEGVTGTAELLILLLDNQTITPADIERAKD